MDFWPKVTPVFQKWDKELKKKREFGKCYFEMAETLTHKGFQKKVLFWIGIITAK